MRYPSARELRTKPGRQDLSRLEDRVMRQLLAVKASLQGDSASEVSAALTAVLLSIAAREGLAADAAAGGAFDEVAFVEAARAAARWAACRAVKFKHASAGVETSCKTH